MASGRCRRPTLGEVARDGNPNGLRPCRGQFRLSERTIGCRLAAATGKQIVFYCAFGERSAMAVQAAQEAGLKTACHIHKV
jgi:rhodanese-related sulfurtransferase